MSGPVEQGAAGTEPDFAELGLTTPYSAAEWRRAWWSVADVSEVWAPVVELVKTGLRRPCDAAALIRTVLETLRTGGCDCTELCSMGPTCPGGALAGLPGSGCWRTPEPSRASADEVDWSIPCPAALRCPNQALCPPACQRAGNREGNPCRKEQP